MCFLAACLLLCVPQDSFLLPLRERAELRDRWLNERLDTLVPRLMRRERIDFWILIGSEYAEDPVLHTMLPATWLSARRRTILVFSDPVARGAEGEYERFAVSRYPVGDLFPTAWDKEAQPDQWKRLAELISEHDPRRIALNVSPTFALADGLTHSQHEDLWRALPAGFAERVVPGERLAIGWLETRTPAEMEIYPSLCRIAHEIIRAGLSAEAVQPGHTTTADLEWWYRERMAELRLETWFHPSVSIQRAREPEKTTSTFAELEGAETIRRGDLIHVDLGITYLGLNTDTQQHAYVLRAGETEAPKGLREGLAAGNRMQDLLMESFVEGRSGNAILAASLAKAAEAGLDARVYTHPLGYHGHGAGPTIGLWDQQEGVPGRGDYPLFSQTAHSIELNVAVQVPEWDDKRVLIMLEEDAFFDGESTRFLDGRQTELFVIP